MMRRRPTESKAKEIQPGILLHAEEGEIETRTWISCNLGVIGLVPQHKYWHKSITVESDRTLDDGFLNYILPIQRSIVQSSSGVRPQAC